MTAHSDAAAPAARSAAGRLDIVLFGNRLDYLRCIHRHRGEMPGYGQE
jgi:hypothetical protein